jgi:protein-disulfide isomerase
MLMFVGMTSDVVAQDFGVISANPADSPPVMNPDVGSRGVDPDRPPSYGPEDAKVLIVLFSDYQCPSCRRVTQATHQISAEFPNEVRIEVWHHPLSIHPNAEIAAEAAVAAQKQGKFWEMHDMMFQNAGALALANLEQYAEVVGLEMDQFRADMGNPAVKERIREESALADALGARATPGFLINGKVSVGWGSWSNFRSKVEREVAAANTLAEQGMDPSEIRNQRAIDNNNDSAAYELYLNAVLVPGRKTAGE